MRVHYFAALFLIALGAGLAQKPAFAQAGAKAPLDVMLCLDNSGSMKTNDPESLMRTAVTEFSARLTPDSRLGIVLFDEKVSVARPLSPAGGADFRSEISSDLKPLDYRGQWTDIPAGVERALYAFQESPRKDAKKIVVLFTDGIVETGNKQKDVERLAWLRDGLAQEAKQSGIQIFGVAFTEGADFQLMQLLAQATGGQYFRVLTSKELPSAFEQISTRIQEVRNAPPAPSAPPVAVRSPGTAFDWRYPFGTGIVICIVGIVFLAARKYQGEGRPAVTAHLRDVTGQTGKQVHRLSKRTMKIGRDSGSNDIVVPLNSVSSKHATIEFRDGAFRLRDLRSTNGTYLNGKRFSNKDAVREVVLKHGDKIRLEACEFDFIENQLQGSEQTRVAVGAEANELLEAPAPSIVGQPAPAAAGMCPNHPSWKATERCPVCQVMKCKTCVKQWDGRTICAQCEANLRVLSGIQKP